MADTILDRFKEQCLVEKEIDLSKTVLVGIIGTGWIAEAHVEAYLRCPDVEIVGAADIVPGKAEDFCRRMGLSGVKCCESHKELLKEVKLDVVSVCTYNRAHAECTVDALDAGVNVLCEKPMSVTLSEAADMCRAEKRSGKLLSIGFQPRLDGNMKMIKKIVDSGILGKVYYLQSGGGRRRGIPTPYGTSFIEEETAGIGAIADIGCYSMDMLLNAVGYPKPLTVSGYQSDYFGKDPKNYPFHPEYAERFGVDDFAAAFVRLEGGMILDFRISWAMNMDTAGDALILGTKGGLRIPSTECWNGSVGGPLKLYHDVCGKQTETVIPLEELDTGDLFYKKIRSFLNAVKDGSPVPVPSGEILYNQAVIDGIVRSAKAGREVIVEIPEI